jgi:16S rRNA (guanine(1405)-N(7))-methyltransferase
LKQKALIAAIKSKKELHGLDDDFVQQKVDKIFAADHTLKRKFDESKDFTQFSRSKVYEDLLKRVRKELRAVYGVFQDKADDRDRILKELRATNPAHRTRIIEELLATHQSTKERIPYDRQVAREIVERTHPTGIIDLGCGLHPLAYYHYPAVGAQPRIVASDVSANDMRFLEECFIALDIPGTTLRLDLTDPTDIAKLTTLPGDVTLLLKLLDSLEEAKRHVSYAIFEHITSEWIIASFPTASLGGKKRIARAGRTWFERLLARRGLPWETFSVENELFYVIHNARKERKANA